MSLERAGIILCCFFIVVAVVGCIADYQARQPKKRKQNIRVPRETLWARTNRYHGSKS